MCARAVHNFIPLDSTYGTFVVNRHCALQAEALVKTGKPHIEAELIDILQLMQHLPDGSVAVDGGANIGLVAIPVAQALAPRGGRVHAFEPQRLLSYALCGSAALNDIDNLVVHRRGLAASRGTLRVPAVNYSQPADYGTVQLEHPQGAPEEDVVDVVALDDLGLERLDFLKLDIEGMEVQALRGAWSLIRTHKPWCWVEYWKAGAPAIMDEFAGLDYMFFKVDALNMLCVPRSRWPSGSPLVIPYERLLPDAGSAPLAEAVSRVALADAALADGRWAKALEWLDFDPTAAGIHRMNVLARFSAACAALDDEEGVRSCAAEALRSLDEGVDFELADLVRRSAGRINSTDLVGTLGVAVAHAEARDWIRKKLISHVADVDMARFWRGESLHGKRILVVRWHFNGDMIQYLRYVQMLADQYPGQVTFAPSPVMHSLCVQSLRGVEFQADGGSAAGFDYWISMFGLAAHFAFTPGAQPIPYIHASPQHLANWAAWLDEVAVRRSGELRVGVAWSGFAAHDAAMQRAASVQAYVPLLQLSGVQCVQLTRDIDSQSIPQRLRSHLITPGLRIADFHELAALVSHMDAVVTTCTATVHVAGALGVPTWLLVGPNADSRWGNGAATALYPSVRIVRCARRGDWAEGVEFIRAALQRLRPRLQRVP